MSQFEYAMVLVSIIVGLGITHILSALGTAVQRLQGYGPGIRLELAYLSWVGYVFGWLVSFWWFEFKWSELRPEFDVGLFLFLMLYAVLLFSLTIVLVPHRLAIVADSWAYFSSIRKWFFSGLLLVNAVDLVDTFMKGIDWGLRPSYLFLWSLVTLAGIAGLKSRTRAVQATLGVSLFLAQIAFSFTDLGVLGAW
jgi:hypothetical protein